MRVVSSLLLSAALLAASSCAALSMRMPTDAERAAEKDTRVAKLVSVLHRPYHAGLVGKLTEDARVDAASELGTIEAWSAVPDLATALQDPDELVRVNASISLWQLSEHAQAAEPALRNALKDNLWWVRYYSAFALYRMDKGGADLLPMLKTLSNVSNIQVAIRAADLAIAIQSDTTGYIPVLMRGMDDLEAGERVVEVIKQERQYREYLPVLLKGTTSDNHRTRNTSVNLLGAGIYASAETTAVLRKAAVSDPNSVVRINATQSLVTGGSLRDIGVPAGSAEGTGGETIDLLVSMLHGSDVAVKETAAEALGAAKSNSPAVLDALVERLGDPDDDIRRAAANALDSIGSGAIDALPALRKVVTDYDARVKAGAKISDADASFASSVRSIIETMELIYKSQGGVVPAK